MNIRKESFALVILGLTFLFALFNPVFKKFDYGAGWPNVLIFSVVVSVLTILFLRERRENSTSAKVEKITLLSFVGLSWISFFLSQTKNVGLSEVVAISAGAAFYLIFAHGEFTVKMRDRFYKLLCFALILAVTLGYVFYVISPEPRMFGPFFNILYHANKWPNAFALFILMCWPFLLLAFKKEKPLKLIFLLGFVIGALFLTYSRGAILAFILQIIFGVIIFVRGLNLKKLLLGIVTILFGGILFLFVNNLKTVNFQIFDLGERVTFQNEEKTTSINERYEFFQGAFALIKEKPFFGFGPFSFRYAYNPIQKNFLANADHPHNIFLKIAVENGVPALGTFMVFLAGILFITLKRLKKLETEKKYQAGIFLIALAGAFAHNMIDYNFNFLANLLVFFLLLILLRNTVIPEQKLVRQKSYATMIFALLIALLSIYEGSILVLSEVAGEKYLQYSLFPRNYYFSKIEINLTGNRFEKVLQTADKQLELNPLDAQAWYLKGVVFCDKDYEKFEIKKCREMFLKAIEINPKNQFSYYRDYIRTFTLESKNPFLADPEITENMMALIEIYFDYVKNNVHFTAYTDNVEAAAEIIDLVSPYLPAADRKSLEEKEEEMLQTAEYLRTNKTF